MKMGIPKPMVGDVPAGSWARRLAWLAAIWLVSIVVLAIMAYGMRLLMSAAGMTANRTAVMAAEPPVQSAATDYRGSDGRVAVLLEPPDALPATVSVAATRHAVTIAAAQPVRGVER